MCLTRFFKDQGILHETSCVHTPQQNERAERKHRHILNIARALRFQANLPIDLWGECVLAAGHLINRTPSSILQNKTPYEKLHGQPPDISHLRVIGCLAYAHNKNTKGDKFASRSRRCVFLGYPAGTKGWKLFDLEQETVFISRDVEFIENAFPYQDNSPITTPTTKTSPALQIVSHDDDSETEYLPPILTTEHNIVETEPIAPTDNDQTDHIGTEPLGRGQRTRQPSTRLRDFVINTVTTIPIFTPSLPSSAPQPSLGTNYPLSDYLTYDRFSTLHRSFLMVLTINIEPKNFRQAMEDEVWRNSMQSEMDALERNHTWDLQELP